MTAAFISRLLALATAVSAVPQLYVDCEKGSDSASGNSLNDAKRSFAGAQQAIRNILANQTLQEDLVAHVAAGTCYLDSPLNFTSADSGRDGYRVIWEADTENGGTDLSGGVVVSDWTVWDESLGIWKASIPKGLESRHLFADQKHMTRARTELLRSSVNYSDGVYSPLDDEARSLFATEGIEHGEIRGINSFTDRFTPIDSKGDNGTLVMAQPAGNNNAIGYDSNIDPDIESGFFLENVLAFLDEENEYYINSTTGTVYFKPSDGADPNSMYTVVPRLEQLLVVSGTYEEPVHDITFRGLNYMHTTWNLPSSNIGYADQQTGAYIGVDKAYPADEFESSRPFWWQIPGSVQASAAHNLTFTNGSMVALMGGFGMGNNAEAHTSGVGLGVKDCEISGMYFSETGANAITFGGVQAEAHHPSDPAMVISGVVITENIFAGTSRTITSGSGILVTYATDTTITHNDLSDLPYSAICFGYGWGSNDVGGSPEYKDRGLYEYQPVYDTPTTLKSGLISGNLIHDYGRVHSDLGAVYTLSACPDTFIERNYIYGMVTSTGTGLYHDEGSRDIVDRDCIVDVAGSWNWRHLDEKLTTGNLTLYDIATTGDKGEGTNEYGDSVSDITKYDGDLTQLDCDFQRIAYEAGIPPPQRSSRQVSSNPSEPSC